MKQTFIPNTEYEILTPNGWENFEGIFLNKNVNKKSKRITFSDDNFIVATDDHRFFRDKKEIKVGDLVPGDCLDSINGAIKIADIQEVILEDTYEIFNATNHVIVVNKIYSHQCDEFSYVPQNIASEFWTSISPTLATGGKAIITSTPNSDEDQFAQIWKEANNRFDEHGNSTELGQNGFYPFSAKWDQHPERDEAWAEAERSRIGEERFRREHNIEFLVFDETLINPIKLSGLKGEEPIMRLGQCRWYKKVNAKSTYIVALDPSLGTGGDPAALQVIELPSFEQVAEWQHNLTPIQGQARMLRDICSYINDEVSKRGSQASIYYSVENNSVGEAALVAINELGEETIPGLFLSEPIKKGHVRRFRRGFNTTHSSKISTCSKLKHLIESDRLKINSKPLIGELKTFVARGISFSGKSGNHDDLVSSLLLALRMIMLLQEWDPAIYDKMREEKEDEYVMPMPIYINRF
jgi:hypothetical protein